MIQVRKIMANSGKIHYGRVQEAGIYVAVCGGNRRSTKTTNKLEVDCIRCQRKFKKGDLMDITPVSDVDENAYHKLVGNLPIYNFDVRKSKIEVEHPVTGLTVSNYEFTDKLRVIDLIRSYRGSALYVLDGSNGKKYWMSPKQMFYMIQLATIDKGEVFGTFTFVKTGGSLKIKMVRAGE